MKLYRTEISPITKKFIYVDYRKQGFLSSPFHRKPSFHSHPELELVYIEKGFGKRIVNNKVERFEDGDLVLLGPHVPHIWLSAPAFYDEASTLESRAIVAYLHPSIFESLFEMLGETSEMKLLFQQAQKGIKILGNTHNEVVELLMLLEGKSGFERMSIVMRIMHLIANSSETAIIGGDDPLPADNAQSDRLVDVIRFMNGHFHEQITLKQVAGIACMAEPSFSRFFKIRTKLTFSRYLENLRINRSLELLLQTEMPVADIAEACGYRFSSHFCKVFKEHTGKSPYQYKQEVRAE